MCLLLSVLRRHVWLPFFFGSSPDSFHLSSSLFALLYLVGFSRMDRAERWDAYKWFRNPDRSFRYACTLWWSVNKQSHEGREDFFYQFINIQYSRSMFLLKPVTQRYCSFELMLSLCGFEMWIFFQLWLRVKITFCPFFNLSYCLNSNMEISGTSEHHISLFPFFFFFFFFLSIWRVGADLSIL